MSEQRRKQLIERWTNAARVLQNLSPHEKRNHFDMTMWGEKTDCGTVGCAGGFCSLDPWFRRRGFSSHFSKTGELMLNSSVHSFFGSRGVTDIFFDTDPRPATQVIKEIRAHVRWLKICEDGDWDYSTQEDLEYITLEDEDG